MARAKHPVPECLAQATTEALAAEILRRSPVALISWISITDETAWKAHYVDKGPVEFLRPLHGHNEARIGAEEQSENKLLAGHYDRLLKADGRVTVEDAGAAGAEA